MKSSVTHVIADRRAATLTKAALRSGERLDLSQAEIARILGLSEASISRMKRERRCLDESSKSWELGALLVRLYRSLDAIMGGDGEAARDWLRTSNQDLRDVPMNMIGSVQGLVSVVGYLDGFRAKV
ncbi:MAG: antitoxin Xre-like helix-turn-helix domain-containing protein [Pseudomonadota bacterium]|nr:antitoxin Xre-like helix-turn-helix domain-containing protein [Pseudomonadota bacterium]